MPESSPDADSLDLPACLFVGLSEGLSEWLSEEDSCGGVAEGALCGAPGEEAVFGAVRFEAVPFESALEDGATFCVASGVLAFVPPGAVPPACGAPALPPVAASGAEFGGKGFVAAGVGDAGFDSGLDEAGFVFPPPGVAPAPDPGAPAESPVFCAGSSAAGAGFRWLVSQSKPPCFQCKYPNPPAKANARTTAARIPHLRFGSPSSSSR